MESEYLLLEIHLDFEGFESSRVPIKEFSLNYLLSHYYPSAVYQILC